LEPSLGRHCEAIRAGQALPSTRFPPPFTHSLSEQQSSEQIGLLLNCLVNGYNDTINCMLAGQLALKSAPSPPFTHLPGRHPSLHSLAFYSKALAAFAAAKRN